MCRLLFADVEKLDFCNWWTLSAHRRFRHIRARACVHLKIRMCGCDRAQVFRINDMIDGHIIQKKKKTATTTTVNIEITNFERLRDDSQCADVLKVCERFWTIEFTRTKIWFGVHYVIGVSALSLSSTVTERRRLYLWSNRIARVNMCDGRPAVQWICNVWRSTEMSGTGRQINGTI